MQTLCQEDEMKQEKELDESCVIACDININYMYIYIYGMRYMDVRMPRWMVHQAWLRLCQLKACELLNFWTFCISQGTASHGAEKAGDSENVKMPIGQSCTMQGSAHS